MFEHIRNEAQRKLLESWYEAKKKVAQKIVKEMVAKIKMKKKKK